MKICCLKQPCLACKHVLPKDISDIGAREDTEASERVLDFDT